MVRSKPQYVGENNADKRRKDAQQRGFMFFETAVTKLNYINRIIQIKRRNKIYHPYVDNS